MMEYFIVYGTPPCYNDICVSIVCGKLWSEHQSDQTESVQVMTLSGFHKTNLQKQL